MYKSTNHLKIFVKSEVKSPLVYCTHQLAGLEQSVRPIRQMPDHFSENSIPQSKEI